MTDETDRLADKIIERFEGDLQERLDEARRDDKGTPHGRLDDETNAVADDRGNRKRRRRGVPRSAVDELDELTTDVDDSKAGITPDDPDGDDDLYPCEHVHQCDRPSGHQPGWHVGQFRDRVADGRDGRNQ